MDDSSQAKKAANGAGLDTITRNELFFANESNRDLYDDSIMESGGSNSTSSTHQAQTSDKITLGNDKLYASLFKSDLASDDTDEDEKTMRSYTSTATSGSFKLPPLLLGATNGAPSAGSTACSGAATAALSRDGFVTNQRYQLLKENKRSASQLTSCYDEVHHVDDNEDDDDDDDDDSSGNSSDENEHDDDMEYVDENASNTSSSSSSSSSNSSRNTSASTSAASSVRLLNGSANLDEAGAASNAGSGAGVADPHTVIDMFDEEDDLNARGSGAHGAATASRVAKQKFYSLVRTKEKHANTSNKYEEEERLLKDLQNECKYGSVTQGETFFDLFENKSTHL
jgi:hypothetical protein